jgi:signal transduction histidine kinase
MRSLRSQLILSHILPLLLVAPLLGVALIYLLETQVLLVNLSERLAERANLIARSLQEQASLWDDPEQARAFVAEITLSVDGRVFLLEPNGTIIAESSDTGAQHLRPQSVERALSGETSTFITYGLLDQGVEVLIPVYTADQQLLGLVAVTQTLTGVARGFGLVRQLVLGTLLMQLLLGGIIGAWLARRLAHPIGRAADAVVDVAEGRPVDLLVPKGPQEIRALVMAIDTLAQRLRLLEETRRRSLANIVHELARPLGSIRSAVHVLRHDAGEDPEIRQELLGGIENQIEHMQPLLDDLAQLHGQVSGEVRLQRKPVELSQWLPPVLLPWRAAALEKGQHWQASIPASLPTSVIDPDRLAQALGNLLSNAIKYTPAQGKILVEAGHDQDEVWIRVADSGPGIAPEEQARIFEPFYRSQRVRRFPQGLGLGLTIARDLVEAHDGRLDLESVPGQGSTFTVHLPLKSNR